MISKQIINRKYNKYKNRSDAQFNYGITFIFYIINYINLLNLKYYIPNYGGQDGFNI